MTHGSLVEGIPPCINFPSFLHFLPLIPRLIPERNLCAESLLLSGEATLRRHPSVHRGEATLRRHPSVHRGKIPALRRVLLPAHGWLDVHHDAQTACRPSMTPMCATMRRQHVSLPPSVVFLLSRCEECSTVLHGVAVPMRRVFNSSSRCCGSRACWRACSAPSITVVEHR